MRYVHANSNTSSNNSQALFCEQVHHLTAMFENWNDCEKTVVLYALLRRLPFPNLKFLQMSIDYNLNFAQTLNSQTKLNFIEDNANSIAFLNKLVHKYTNLITSSSNKKCDKNDTTTSSSSNCSATTASIANDSGINNSSVNINDSANKSIENDLDLMGKYSSKEEIVMDLLVYLPLMKPGNDDVKKIYIQLIPIMLEDSIRQIIPVELVQQALSYLLIHPAINNDDRKNLSQWLRHLEEHIAFTYIQQTKGISPNNYPNLPQDNASSFMSTASTSSSSSSSSSASSTSSSTWQTVQPPNANSAVNANNGSNTNNNTTNNKAAAMTMPPPPPLPTAIQTAAPAPNSGWDYQNIQINQEFCDDLNQTRFPKPIGNIGNKNSSQSSLNSSKNNTHSNSSSIIFENDDHHVSFSKNGTEIIDYDQIDDFMGGPQSDGGGSNGGTNDLTSNTTGPKKITKKYRDASNNVIATVTLTDFLHVPTTSMFNDHLFDSMGIYDNVSDDCNAFKTRRSNSLTTPTASGQLCSSSAENLTNLQQKPRSFSLSMESSRNALISSGSDTRLDDFNKMNGMKMNGNPHHSGMSHIGQWLKSLRLHKYFWLFSNMSYEQMMEMSEEYLENLGVTKGARHKLVLCIQKLSERMKILYQIERELMDGSRCLKSGLDELTQIVMTPMKPVNSVPRDEDVALQFLKVLECAFQVLVNIKYLSQQDEEAVNVFLWVIDKTLHNDAFLQQFNHLKEYKFKLSKAKMTFAPKSHYNKSQPNLGGNNKMRWNPNGKLHKTGNNQNINSSNSNISSSSDNPSKNHRKGSMQAFQMYNSYNNGNHNANKNSKSSSYPNFVTSNQHQMTNNQRSSSRDKLHVLIQQQQQQMQTKKQPPPPPQQQAQIMSSQMNPNAAPYHRNSLNNLMNQQTLLQMQQLQQPQNNCGSLGGSLKSLSSNSSSNHGDGINTTSYASSLVGNSNNNNSNSCNISSNNNQISNNLLMMSHKHGGQVAGSIGDINSRLESLCLQMTEQAIN